MKTVIILIALLALNVAVIKAQMPSPDPDTLKTPVKQGDPEVRQKPSTLYNVEDIERISPEQLPTAVRDKLKRAEYKDWEKSVLYRDKKRNIYSIEIRDGGNTRTYQFNKSGQLLEQSEDEDYKNQKGN